MVKIPVRNKDKYNPYTLGYDEDSKTYVVEFVDNMRVIHKVQVSDKIYEAFNEFELEDVSQIHKYQKHIEHNEVYEETLNARAINKPISVEDEVENKIMTEILKNAINTLSLVQKRRIKMYYFEDMTLKQIAELEHCSIMSVKESLDSGINKLRKIIKN